MDHLGTKILVDGGKACETQQMEVELFADARTTAEQMVAQRDSELCISFAGDGRSLTRNSTCRSLGRGSLSATNSPARACKNSQTISAKP
jgi:hypothetical protein